MLKIISLTALALVALSANALAVSDVVKQACKSDYVSYCSEHKVGSAGLRSCMRAHRKMLLDGCITALGNSDEVTEADVKTYKREMNQR